MSFEKFSGNGTQTFPRGMKIEGWKRSSPGFFRSPIRSLVAIARQVSLFILHGSGANSSIHTSCVSCTLYLPTIFVVHDNQGQPHPTLTLTSPPKLSHSVGVSSTMIPSGCFTPTVGHRRTFFSSMRRFFKTLICSLNDWLLLVQVPNVDPPGLGFHV